MKCFLIALSLCLLGQVLSASEYRATVYALRCPTPGIPDLKDSDGKTLVLDYQDSTYFLDVVARGLGTIAIVADGTFSAEKGGAIIGQTAPLRIDSGKEKPDGTAQEYGAVLTISDVVPRVSKEDGVEIPLMQMKIRLEATLSEDEKAVQIGKDQVAISEFDLGKVGTKKFDGYLGVIKGIPGIVVIPFNDRMALLVRINQID